MGEASVSPYPSRISTPNRSRIVSATEIESREAPDNARRTVAKVSAGSSSKCAKVAQSAGAPGMTVIRRSWIDWTAVDGSNRCTSTIVAPTRNPSPTTTLSPKMWKSGSTP
jgi:hypothetical protein